VPPAGATGAVELGQRKQATTEEQERAQAPTAVYTWHHVGLKESILLQAALTEMIQKREKYESALPHDTNLHNTANRSNKAVPKGQTCGWTFHSLNLRLSSP